MLMDNISQLVPIKTDVLGAIKDEINSAKIPYKAVYDDYQSGGWHTAVLYAPGGDNSDGTVRDGIASPTQLAKDLPITQQFLDGLGLDFFTVRIACNDPDSWLWEHRDYVELNEEQERLRLHVPLITSPNAIMQFSHCAVHMATGWLWKLNPMVNHAISNTGTESRTHLILDCYKDQALRKLVGNEVLEAQNLRSLPLLDTEERCRLLIHAQDLFARSGSEKAEQYLLKTFHRFDLGEETSYDLLIDFYHDMGFRNQENHWISEQITRIYHREKINPDEPVNNMRGTLFKNPHASSTNLPHFSIFQQVLHTCRQCPGLEKVYARGSLARGDADPHSDIDLLCIVAPQEFSSFLKNVDICIKKQHNTIADGWVDTIVKNFGGVGFVYLLQTDSGLYQLDLYIACQGHPALDYLDHVPHKHEIFRQCRKENSNPRQDALLWRLHGDTVEHEIQRINSVEPSVSRTLTELSVLGFMVKKCLERGDLFVACNEYNMWKNCFIKLVRQKFDTQHRDYGFYHVNRLIVAADDKGKLYGDLCAIIEHPLTSENFTHVHHYAMDFVQEYFPEDHARNLKMIHAVTRHIEDYRPEPLKRRLASLEEANLQLVSFTLD